MEKRPLFIGSEIYRGSTYGAWHPLRVPRVSTVMDLSRALGWLPHDVYVPSPRAKPSALHVWHDPDYVAALLAAETTQTVSDAVREIYGLGTPVQSCIPRDVPSPCHGCGWRAIGG